MKNMFASIDSYQRKIQVHRPFDSDLLPQIKEYYKISLTYTSNAIEGFSYTESETKVLLEDGLTVGGKPLRDALAVTGHAKAYDYMFSLFHTRSITNHDIKIMHGMLDGSLNSGKAGIYRKRQVFVTGSQYSFPRPDEVQSEMDAFEGWMQTERDKLHPVEYAVLLHKHLVFIHPFEDGNGRISRLAMNMALIQDGHLPIAVPPILRSEYIASLEAAHKNDTQFKEFMFRQEIEAQRSFLRLIGNAEPEQRDDDSKKKREEGDNIPLELRTVPDAQVRHVITMNLAPKDLEKTMPYADADNLREELRKVADSPEAWGINEEAFTAWGKEHGLARQRQVPTPAGARTEIVYDNF